MVAFGDARWDEGAKKSVRARRATTGGESWAVNLGIDDDDDRGRSRSISSSVETLGDGVDELFGRETGRSAEIASTLALAEELVDDGAHLGGEGERARLVDVVDLGGVIHGADQTFHHHTEEPNPQAPRNQNNKFHSSN